MNSWKFRIGIVLVFALGVVIGGLGTGWWAYRHFHNFHIPRARMEGEVMKRLSGYLDLTDAQKADVGAIVHDVAAQLEAVRVKTEPEVTKALEDGMARMKAKLSAEQYAKLEKRYQEMRGRWQRRYDR